MKTLKTNFIALLLLAIGVSFITTSCSKDDGTDNKDFTFENVAGKYAGNHKLNIPSNLLTMLSAALPVDSVTGEKPDLTKGFDDTLTISVVDGKVNVTSWLLGITVQGELSASNTVKIKETKYDELSLGAVVKAKNASIATSKDVKFNSKAIGAVTNVQLRLKAGQIATFTIPLDITTNGDFTKFED
ncbi:MAG: hypothetical protein LC105_02105 [Chitinophagales bacterium]|nr:hypothetical protein [Chitinophagales bacterium]MCZ2392636.1 hypothetical protein [Chitinophagales bacterium]